MKGTAIQWTWRTDPATGALIPNSGSTWNPLLGCRRVSPGCEHCYAERLEATRLSKHPYYAGLAVMRENGPQFTGEHRMIVERLTDPLVATKGRKIFVNDLGDLFYEGHTNEEIAAVFGIMGIASHHTFQVLTKRVKRALDWYAWVSSRTVDLGGGTMGELHPFAVCAREARRLLPDYRPLRKRALPNPMPWPMPNIWVGVSTEDQKRAEERIPLLLKVPAAIRFLSVEPQLGPIDLTDLVLREGSGEYHFDALTCDVDPEDDGDLRGATIDWVICGGESGPGARPFDLAWARSLRDQCRAAGTAFFLKQLGAHPIATGCAVGPGTSTDLSGLKDSHGGDPSEWPSDLQGCRAFPETRTA